MRASTYFMVEYQGLEAGCPEFFLGSFNHEEWEWDEYDPNPEKFLITNKYVFKVTDKKIKHLDFDYSGSPNMFVSQRFLDVCDKLNVKYRAIPVDVLLADNTLVDKDYFIFLSAQAVVLLDESKSDYRVETDLESGSVIYNNYYKNTPMYSWIKKYKTRKAIGLDFFRCIETMRMACSSAFVVEATSLNLKGLNFIPIDEEYQFDPWGELV